MPQPIITWDLKKLIDKFPLAMMRLLQRNVSTIHFYNNILKLSGIPEFDVSYHVSDIELMEKALLENDKICNITINIDSLLGSSTNIIKEQVEQIIKKAVENQKINTEDGKIR